MSTPRHEHGFIEYTSPWTWIYRVHHPIREPVYENHKIDIVQLPWDYNNRSPSQRMMYIFWILWIDHCLTKWSLWWHYFTENHQHYFIQVRMIQRFTIKEKFQVIQEWSTSKIFWDFNNFLLVVAYSSYCQIWWMVDRSNMNICDPHTSMNVPFVWELPLQPVWTVTNLFYSFAIDQFSVTSKLNRHRTSVMTASIFKLFKMAILYFSQL